MRFYTYKDDIRVKLDTRNMTLTGVVDGVRFIIDAFRCKIRKIL